jgi:hypothetical protein
MLQPSKASSKADPASDKGSLNGDSQPPSARRYFGPGSPTFNLVALRGSLREQHQVLSHVLGPLWGSVQTLQDRSTSARIRQLLNGHSCGVSPSDLAGDGSYCAAALQHLTSPRQPARMDQQDNAAALSSAPSLPTKVSCCCRSGGLSRRAWSGSSRRCWPRSTRPGPPPPRRPRPPAACYGPPRRALPRQSRCCSGWKGLRSTSPLGAPPRAATRATRSMSRPPSAA